MIWNEAEITLELENDIGQMIEDFEFIDNGFAFTVDGEYYRGCESEEDAEKIAREWLADDPVSHFGLEGVALRYFDTERYIYDVLSTDGWAHVICTYDGDYVTTKNGLVYWRE